MISERFTKIYVACYLLSISIAFFLSSYSNYRLTEAISYNTNDGWCDPSTQGIGNHCFGDYYYPLSLATSDSPWSGSPNPYPPLALAVYKPFEYLTDVLGARSALLTYIGFLIACLVGTLIFVIKKNKLQGMNYTLVLLATVGSAPILSVIDRGNSAILLFPIVYFWIVSVKNRNPNHILILSCMAASLRPQFLSLCLILLFLGDIKFFVMSIILSFLSIFLSFILFGNNVFTNFVHWAVQIIRYQEYAAVASIFPVNVSFSNSIHLVFKVMNVNVSEIGVKILTYLLFLLFVWLYWRNRDHLPTTLKIISVLITPIFFVGTAFHYYLFIISLIFINYVLENKVDIDRQHTRSKFTKFYSFVTRLLFLLVLIPWALPWGIFPGLDASRGWPVIGIQWALAQGTFMVFALLTFYVYPQINVRIRK